MQTNYKEVKKLLLNAIDMLGYAKDSVKSCAAWLVFRNQANDKIVVARKNDYTTFFNPNVPEDKGDVIDFLLHRMNGGIDTTITQKNNTERLQQTLRNLVGYVPSVATPVAVAEAQAAKAPMSYDIRPLPVVSALPFDAAQLLRIRGIRPDVLTQPDILPEVGLLHSGRHENLFFRWRDRLGNPAGGQYKYLNVQTGGTAKYFLSGTTRHNSVWCTNPKNKCSLFVCEDPFDAIAYRQLNPNNHAALLATGGAVTIAQIDIIKSIAKREHIPMIVLGNDNDIAGQINNLKIVDEATQIISVDAKQQAATLRYNGAEKHVTLSELKDIVMQRCRQSHDTAYYLAAPTKKDWNEELLPPAKATPSAALKAVLNSISPDYYQPQQQSNNNSMHYSL
jgi:hypothetical protein